MVVVVQEGIVDLDIRKINNNNLILVINSRIMLFQEIKCLNNNKDSKSNNYNNKEGHKNR